MRRSALSLCFTSKVPHPSMAARPSNAVGYGPFSATARPRGTQQQQKDGGSCSSSSPSSSSSSSSSTAASAAGGSGGSGGVDVMSHLQTNLNLQLSLAGLLHPSDIKSVTYQSPEWRLAMARLYRTILRLHNKTVAVSVDRARAAGGAEAVSSATGIGSGGGGARAPTSKAEAAFLAGGGGSGGCAATSPAAPPLAPEDVLLRYLLTPQQREFGNMFVQGEFSRHMDADAVSSHIFYESWYAYILQLASGITAREMTEEERRLLTPEQQEKLNELRGAFTSMRAQQEPGYMI